MSPLICVEFEQPPVFTWQHTAASPWGHNVCIASVPGPQLIRGSCFPSTIAFMFDVVNCRQGFNRVSLVVCSLRTSSICVCVCMCVLVPVYTWHCVSEVYMCGWLPAVESWYVTGYTCFCLYFCVFVSKLRPTLSVLERLNTVCRCHSDCKGLS